MKRLYIVIKIINGTSLGKPMAAVEATFIFQGLNDDLKRIDLAQVASIVNRKLNRQSQQWVVQGLELRTQEPGYLTVSRLPNNWCTVNAINKAYFHWKEQQDETAREAGIESTRARYRDFKVFSSTGHAQAGTGDNWIPYDYLPQAGVTPGTSKYDWAPSTVVVPNAANPTGLEVGTQPKEWYLHVLGPDQEIANDSKGLIKAYAESRARPQQEDPNIVNVDDGGLYGAMENVGNDDPEIIENYQDDNNEAPYLNDVYPSGDEYYPGGGGLNGDAMIEEARLTSNASGNTIRSTHGGFIANMGLLEVNPVGISNYLLVVRLASDEKGFITRPILEAN